MSRTAIGIKPTVDCVFHDLLSKNKEILLDFLNAILKPEHRILDVEIRDPINSPLALDGSKTIVDVKAQDVDGRIFQIEMQVTNETGLKARMLYTWSHNFYMQLGPNEPYSSLKPVIAIWVLAENTFRHAPDVHHRFVPYDPAHRLSLGPHMEIHTLELGKWKWKAALDDIDRWVYFFKDAERWGSVPPPEADTPVMRQAMSVLEEFKNNEEKNEYYRRRLDFLRRQRTQEVAAEEYAKMQVETERLKNEIEQLQTVKEQLQAVKEQAQLEKEQAQLREAQMKAKLEALLQTFGVDPSTL